MSGLGASEAHAADFAIAPWSEVCSTEGWCWDNPRPQGATLNAASDGNASDLWVAGASGTALHFDGTSWQGWTTLLPNHENIVSVHRTSATDVWLLGSNGSLLHYNGSAFTTVSHLLSGQSTTSVWAASASDYWIAGATQLEHHTVNGSSTVALGGVLDIFGFSSTNVYAVTTTGVYHYNGTAWSLSTQTVGAGFKAIWGASASDFWVLGTVKTLHNVNGNWSLAAGAIGQSLSGSASNDVWIANGTSTLRHWNGSAWTTFAGVAPGSLGVLSTTGRALAFGRAGSLAAVDTHGNTVQISSGQNDLIAGQDAHAVQLADGSIATFTLASGELFIGQNANLHWSYSATTFGCANCSAINGVWGPRTTQLWFATSLGLYHFDGANWALSVQGAFNDVWGSSEYDVYAAGPGSVVHFDGNQWTMAQSNANETFVSVHGSSPSDVWALAQSGNALHYNGQTWTSTSTGGAGADVWSVNSQLAYAVGDQVFSRWNGSSWQASALSGHSPKSIAGDGSGKVVAAGDPFSDILRFDGNAWNSDQTPGGTLMNVISPRGSAPFFWPGRGVNILVSRALTGPVGTYSGWTSTTGEPVPSSDPSGDNCVTIVSSDGTTGTVAYYYPNLGGGFTCRSTITRVVDIGGNFIYKDSGGGLCAGGFVTLGVNTSSPSVLRFEWDNLPGGTALPGYGTINSGSTCPVR